MDVTTPSFIFSFFHFLVENKEKSALFLLVFLPGIIPLKFLKTQNWKKLIFIGFSCFWHLQLFLWRRSRQINPRKSFSLSAGGQSPPGQSAYEGSQHSPLLYPKPLQSSPPFRKHFPISEMEPDNAVLPSCPST